MASWQGLTNHENVDFDATWGVLEGALREIHTKNASKLSFEELYRNAYKLVLKKKGEELYNRVNGLEEELLRENVRSKVAQMVTPSLILGATGEQLGGQAHQRRADGERFLRVLKDAYADHHLCMSMITDVLMYMVSLLTFLSVWCVYAMFMVHNRNAHTARTNAIHQSIPRPWPCSERRSFTLQSPTSLM